MFERLAAGTDVGDLGLHCGLDARRAEAMLRALAATGLAEEGDGRFHLDRARELGAALRSFCEWPRAMTHALRTASFAGSDYPERVPALAAIHAQAIEAAALVLSGERILDVGAGSAAWSLAVRAATRGRASRRSTSTRS